MNGFAGNHPRRKAVTLIEAVLFISIALAVIVGGLVFYQQASLAMKVMNVKRHVESALAETRVIQSQTNAWSYDYGAALKIDITDVLNAYGALAPISNGFGNMEVEFAIVRLDINTISGVVPPPADICGATAVEVLIKDIPVRACTRMVVTDETFRGFLSTGQIAVQTGYIYPEPDFAPTRTGAVAPITPQDAADLCTYGGIAPSSGTIDFSAYFMILPPSHVPIGERRERLHCNV
jgi:hypothetical protein